MIAARLPLLLAMGFFPRLVVPSSSHPAASEALQRVELHIHLDGSIDLEELLVICHRRNIQLAGKAPQSAADVLSFIEQHPGWHRFDVVNDIIGGDADTIAAVAESFVDFQARSGVKYTEVRYDPVRLGHSGLLNSTISEEEAVKAVQAGLAKGAARHGVEAYQILCAMRGKSELACNQTAELAARLQSYAMGGVVGLDLAGDESDFGNAMYARCLRHAKRGLGLRTTVHSGEFGDTTAEEVRIAVEQMEVDRVGHGYAAVKDDAVMALLKQKQVHVEACPKSAFLHGPWEFAAIGKYRTSGLSFGINTDDPTSFLGNTSMAAAEALLQERLSFTPADMSRAYAAAYAARFSTRTMLVV